MKRVFVASRFEKFREIRKKLKKELLDCNLYPIDLNDNTAVSHEGLKLTFKHYFTIFLNFIVPLRYCKNCTLQKIVLLLS